MSSNQPRHTPDLHPPKRSYYNPSFGNSAVPQQAGDVAGIVWGRAPAQDTWQIPQAHPIDEVSEFSPASGTRLFENPVYQHQQAAQTMPAASLMTGVKSADRVVLKQWYNRHGLSLDDDAIDAIQAQLAQHLQLAPAQSSQPEPPAPSGNAPVGDSTPYARRRVLVEEEYSPGRQQGDHFTQALQQDAPWAYQPAFGYQQGHHAPATQEDNRALALPERTPARSWPRPTGVRHSPEVSRQLLQQSLQAPLPDEEAQQNLIDLSSHEEQATEPEERQPASILQSGPSGASGSKGNVPQLSRAARRRRRAAARKASQPQQNSTQQQQPIAQPQQPAQQGVSESRKREQRSTESSSLSQQPLRVRTRADQIPSDPQPVAAPRPSATSETRAEASLNPHGQAATREGQERIEKLLKDQIFEFARRRSPERVRPASRIESARQSSRSQHSSQPAAQPPRQQPYQFGSQTYPPPPQAALVDYQQPQQVVPPTFQPQFPTAPPTSQQQFQYSQPPTSFPLQPPPPPPPRHEADPAPQVPARTDVSPQPRTARARRANTSPRRKPGARERTQDLLLGLGDDSGDEWAAADIAAEEGVQGRHSKMEHWLRVAKQLNIPRLGRRSSYEAYVGWREDVRLVASMVSAQKLTQLRSDGVQILARQVLEQDLYDELRRGGDLLPGCTWETINDRVREILGYTPPLLRARLRECKQPKDQSPQDFIKDFLFLAREGGVDEQTCKDHLLLNVNEATYRLIGEKLDVHATVSSSPRDLERITFNQLANILREGSILSNAGYPLRVERVKLHRGGQSSDRRGATGSTSAPKQDAVYEEPSPRPGVLSQCPESYSRRPPSQNRVSYACEGPEEAICRLEAALTVARDVEEDMWEESRGDPKEWSSYVEDAYSLVLTAALVMQQSREVAEAEGDAQGVSLIDSVAQDALDQLQAYYATVHPHSCSVELVPRKARRDNAPTTLFDVVRGFARKVPLSRMLELETDVRPYMAAVVVEAIRAAGDSLIVPEDIDVKRVTSSEFEDRKLELSAKQYQPFGLLTSLTRRDPAEDEAERSRRRDRQRDEIVQNLANNMHQMTEAMDRIQTRLLREEGEIVPDYPSDYRGVMDHDAPTGRSVVGEDVDHHRHNRHPRQRSVQPAEFKDCQRKLIRQVVQGIYAMKARNHNARVVGVGWPCARLESFAVAPGAAFPQGEASPHIYAAIMRANDDPANYDGTQYRAAIMVDTGASFSMISSQTAKMHGLEIQPYQGVFQSASMQHAPLCGMVDMALQVSNNLVLEIQGLKVQKSDQYSFLLGADVLTGDGQHLGQVEVLLGRCIQWEVIKDDAVYRSALIGSKPRVAAVQPSSAPSTTGGTPPSGSQPALGDTALPAKLDAMSASTFTKAQLSQLHEYAERRTAQVKNSAPIEEAKQLCGEIGRWLDATKAPQPLRKGLGQCLWRRYRDPTHTQRCAELVAAFDRSFDHFRAAVKNLKLREERIFD